MCLDIDECQSRQQNDCEVNCTNTAGSFECSCPSGYRLSSDLHSCEDINECAEKTAHCEQRCNNTEGSFDCSCFEGFAPNVTNPKACVEDRNANSVCQNNNCEHACRATNSTTGSFSAECFCPVGYDLDPTNNKSCTDHNECQDHVSPCSQACNNTVGGFSCSCYSGFHLDKDQRTCISCPPFTYGPNCLLECYCHGHGQRCDPDSGCVCQPGWTGSGCEHDIDECDDPDACPQGQVCMNNNGSFDCSCQQGYVQTEDGTCEGKGYQEHHVNNLLGLDMS